MDLSIIIVSFNTQKLLRDCLESLRKISDRDNLDSEVIVVDNASTDGTLEMVRQSYPRVELICNSDNLGFSKANNLGIKKSRGRFALLLNSDTIVPEGSLAKLVNFARADESVGVAGPQLLNPDGTLQRSGSKKPSWLRDFFYYAGLWNRAPQFFAQVFDFDWGRDFARVQEVEVLPGAALLIRREVFDRVGLLDENIFMYYEDVDFCRRVRSAGFKVVYYPQAKIYHYQGSSAAKVNVKANQWIRQGALYYSQKYRPDWQTWLLKQLFKFKGYESV